jgi:AcrR family transcriptional regulator
MLRPDTGEAGLIAGSLSFAAVLEGAAARTALRKVERTRLRLLAAVARLLDAGREESDLRVSDIVGVAGIAHGTFYRYFADRRAAVEALIGDFARFQRDCLGSVSGGAPASEARVRATTLVYVRLFKANAGLMRCMMDLGNEVGGFRERYHALNRDWNGRVAAAIAERRAERGLQPVTPAALLPRAYALDGMVDEFLTQIFVRRDPALAPLADDEEAVAGLLSELWCLGAYGRLSAF